MSKESFPNLERGVLFEEMRLPQAAMPAPTLPTLQELLEVVERQSASIRFARRNHASKCPLAKLYQVLCGGTWLVDTEVIVWFKGKGEKGQVWCWIPPEDVVEVLWLLDDPSWKPGRPHKTITYGELGTMLRTVLSRQSSTRGARTE